MATRIVYLIISCEEYRFVLLPLVEMLCEESSKIPTGQIQPQENRPKRTIVKMTITPGKRTSAAIVLVPSIKSTHSKGDMKVKLRKVKAEVVPYAIP